MGTYDMKTGDWLPDQHWSAADIADIYAKWKQALQKSAKKPWVYASPTWTGAQKSWTEAYYDSVQDFKPPTAPDPAAYQQKVLYYAALYSQGAKTLGELWNAGADTLGVDGAPGANPTPGTPQAPDHAQQVYDLFLNP